MRVLFINTTGGTGSHGRIAFELATQLEAKGNECRIAYGRNPSTNPDFVRMSYKIGNDFEIGMHVIQTRILDQHGFGSIQATKKFLKWADKWNPDFLWLHNIHGYYINIELLFTWIKSRPDMKVNWTLHDCWAFTGHCSHFTVVNCGQWKTHCSCCRQKNQYPSSLVLDCCRSNFDRKKLAFTGVKNMTLITPSEWLANLVKQSFLREYPCEVHYNQIDTNVFKPTPSNFREKYGLQDKKIVLGVANVWHKRKGLDDFLRLAQMLDENYVILLVGLTERQIRNLPHGIKGIGRTSDTHELAAIYTMADVFVNPSREETFGMTTIEAEACGTNAIVYEGTACEEVVQKMGGIAVPQDVEAIYQAITNKACLI
jgi:glycosyltransferase involved in cell wall biosynthesis